MSFTCPALSQAESLGVVSVALTVTKFTLQNHQQKDIPLFYHLNEQKLIGGCWKFTSKFLLKNLAYTNSIALLADSKSNLEDMLRSLDSTCTALGPTVSTSKTKLMTVLIPGQTDPAVPVALHSSEADVQVIDTFAYLGCLVTDDCNVDAEVNSCIEKALGASLGSFGIKK